MRWYELDPTVYMAISMIEMADFPMQVKCAKFILKKIDNLSDDYVLKNIIALSEAQIHPKNRWYDKNELISKAFDYLKHVPAQNQKLISQNVLDYLKPAA
ncbi:hypothetical protein J6E39_03685 [bacterium]|nr:hypothetical protein [bacterium]